MIQNYKVYIVIPSQNGSGFSNESLLYFDAKIKVCVAVIKGKLFKRVIVMVNLIW